MAQVSASFLLFPWDNVSSLVGATLTPQLELSVPGGSYRAVLSLPEEQVWSFSGLHLL